MYSPFVIATPVAIFVFTAAVMACVSITRFLIVAVV